MTPMTSKRNGMMPARLALAAMATVAMGLGACGGEDEHAAAIRQAKMDLETLAATYQPGETGGKTSYQKVISSLDDAAEGSGGSAAAARVIRSRAFVRQGDEAAATVTEIERRAQGISTTIRRFQDQWLDLQAQAQALRKYDPSEDLKKIDEQVAAKSQEIEQTKTGLAEAEREYASLRQQAEEALSKSRAQRDQELVLRGQMIDQSQTARAELVRQANEVKRVGDGFDVQAADLMAQAGREQPRIAELQLRVQRLEAQKLMLEASKDQVAAAAAQAEKQAQRAHAGVVGAGGGVEFVGAKQVGEELTKAASELREVRAGLAGPTEEANRLYGQALGEVQRAKSAGGGAAGARGAGNTKLAEASVHHAQADLLLVRGRGLQAHASLMKRLAETKPALPNGAEYEKAGAEAATDAQEQMQAAQEAFTTARDLYEAAGQSQKAQEVKDRLELIARSLAAFAAPGDAVPGETEAGEATETAAVEPPAGETPEVAAKPAATFEGEQAEVYALLERIAETMKAKDYDALVPMMVFRNAEQAETFRKAIPLMTKLDELDAACREQFGRSYYEIEDEYVNRLGIDTSAAKTQPGDRELARLRTLDPSDLEIRVVGGGSEAEVRRRSARTADPLEAMKVDGAWKLKLDYQLEGGLSPEAYLQVYGKALDATITNVKSGKYGSDSEQMMREMFAEIIRSFADKATPDDENK